MNLKKSKLDIKTEQSDLEKDQVMNFIRNMKSSRFNVGDILICKVLNDWQDDKHFWEVERDSLGIPVQYLYAFENELGIGYLKKLRPDGKGPYGRKPTPMTKVDLNDQRFELDPNYADHLILGEGEFDYAIHNRAIIAARDEAIKKNTAMAINTENEKEYKQFWKDLKVGDMLYAACAPEITDLGEHEYRVAKITATKKGTKQVHMEIIANPWDDDIGTVLRFSKTSFYEEHAIVTKSKPFPLKEDLT